jgi:hypothetical protein
MLLSNYQTSVSLERERERERERINTKPQPNLMKEVCGNLRNTKSYSLVLKQNLDPKLFNLMIVVTLLFQAHSG